MKSALIRLSVIFLLSVPVAANAQIRYSDPANRNLAMQIAARVQETLKSKERKWKFKDTIESEFGISHYYRSGSHRLELRIFVHDSPEIASKKLQFDAKWSSLTAESPLNGIGDEAFYISHRYFTWIGVRKGRMLVEVYGPPEITVTRRIAQYGLDEMSEK